MKLNSPNSKITVSPVKSTPGFSVVGVGASAGGLDAFKKFLRAIPENTGLAYVLVQHLNPDHESLLPEILQKVTNIPVGEISAVTVVEPNHIYIIPENKLVVASDGDLQLIPRPPKNKNIINLPIDLFFNSLAQVHQSNAIGVVLSGTASDGTIGLKAIKDHGGITFAQNEESAAFAGMPHNAIHAGVVDFILPPEEIPAKIIALCAIINRENADDENIPLKDEEAFRQILSVLRIRKGNDFTYYKQTTIRRRILRRMAFNRNEQPSDYLKYLRENKKEQDLLYQDLLIPVTNFFRDPKSFENLFESVFPEIIKNTPANEPIRLWVAGCSTGEEAYSIAICLREYLDGRTEKVQIFATDISEPAVTKARMGVYSKVQMEGVSAERLQEFFVKTNGGFQVHKSIRNMCVFAVHNFLKDPPFGKLNFVSCRNVLIYMEPYLQKKALTTFHYALKREGFLMLGKSETTTGVADLFAIAVKNDRFFSRIDVPGKSMIMASQRSEQNFRDSNTDAPKPNIRTDFQKTADDIMLSRFSPIGVVVNEAMDIVHFRGNTTNYLEQLSGKPTHNLIKLGKQGLPFELRNILHKAKKEKASVVKENIPIKINDIQQHVTIEAIPLPNAIEAHYLILFHERNYIKVPSVKVSSRLKRDEKDLRIQQLETELSQIREDMRNITEDQEAAYEELQSANEELLSSSEELQSLNEELETGKEELQSTNEEVTVVNNELLSTNEQVIGERNFSDAIIANLHEPLIVLDYRLRIKICNDAFFKTFLTNEIETEDKLIYELDNGGWNIAELRSLLEKILPQQSKLVEYEIKHTFSKIGERFLLLNAKEIIKQNSNERLILLSIKDITSAKKAQEKMKEKNAELEQINKELHSFSYIASHDLQEPLRKIQILSSHLMEKENQNLSNTGKEYFHRMQVAANRMQKLIKDLLSFSNVNNIERKFELTDINQIVEEVKRDFDEILHEKQVVIETTEMCAVKLIPFQFRQVIQNLISNSIKFSKPGIPPHIMISSTIVKGDNLNLENVLPEKKYCHIIIKDNGIGFESEYNNKVFEVFERLHSKEEYSGTGIGLSIVKKIVDNHNGLITAKGEINKGATFDIYIPTT